MSSSNDAINIPKIDENNKLHYYKDLTNKKFGKLTVIKYLYTNHRRKAVWLYKCDCGNEIEVPSERLSTGNTRSCGCLHIYSRKDNIKKAIQKNIKYHSKEEAKIMKKFNQMKARCYHYNCKAYKNYGGRGIKICDEWLKEPKKFYYWSINNNYEDFLSIDRIDVNGNYEPNNCRWVTNLKQQNNKRNNTFLTYNGEIHTLAEWSRIRNIPKSTISDRIRRKFNVSKILNNNYKSRR